MIRVPHMLLVGASGQNQGKSTLACELISRYAADRKIVGAKITTIRESTGECPRGGEGCGVCAAMEGEWAVTEEVGDNPHKDTGRMLTAGADQVFWLRVRAAHLEEGVHALLERIGPDRPVVSEGNSPRLVLEPGVFLVSRDRAKKVDKPSAAAVRHLADQTLLFDGKGFDLSSDRIGLDEGRWTYRREATAVIMAGGKSRRMGQDKSLIEVGGKPLIAHIAHQLRPHFDELLVSANDPHKYTFLDLPVVADRVADQGPLMGISSALMAARHDRVFVTATDIPELDVELMSTLLRRTREHQGAVPRTVDGHLEPLFAVYRKPIVAAMDAALAGGNRSVRSALDQCDLALVDLDADADPVNLNTPDDLARYAARCR